MKVLVMRPGEFPKIEEIGEELEDLQAVVGGSIEAVYPFDDLVALVCNEEGKLQENIEWSVPLIDEDNHIYDFIAGTCFLVGVNNEEGTFISLTDEQTEKYKKYYSEIKLLGLW